MTIVLRPGQVGLADWRALYRGAPLALDPVSRADVEAGAAALQAVRAKENAPARPQGGDGGPTVVELLHKNGSDLPAAIVRLFVALKLASLAQGMSGVRWTLVQSLVDCLAKDLLPAVPAANATDRLALSHLFGILTGTGEILADTRSPAAKAFKRAGLAPLKLDAEERHALLSGTQLSTALALAGLFEAERVLQSGLVAAALTIAAAGRADALVHPRVYKLRRQPGQIEVAAALRILLQDGSAAGEAGVAASGSTRIFPQMGACLDLLRQAGATLESAANSVSEDRLVIWQTGEVVAGLEDASPVAFAADLIALALHAVGSFSERRMAVLPPGAAQPENGDAAAAGTPLAMAASFNAENAARLRPAEAADGGSEAAAGVRRLLPMAGTASLVVAIELLAATRGGERAAPVRAGALERVVNLVRERMPQSGEANLVPAADLAAAAELVRSGALVEAAGFELPSVLRPRIEPRRRRLGARADRP